MNGLFLARVVVCCVQVGVKPCVISWLLSFPVDDFLVRSLCSACVIVL